MISRTINAKSVKTVEHDKDKQKEMAVRSFLGDKYIMSWYLILDMGRAMIGRNGGECHTPRQAPAVRYQVAFVQNPNSR